MNETPKDMNAEARQMAARAIQLIQGGECLVLVAPVQKVGAPFAPPVCFSMCRSTALDAVVTMGVACRVLEMVVEQGCLTLASAEGLCPETVFKLLEASIDQAEKMLEAGAGTMGRAVRLDGGDQ